MKKNKIKVVVAMSGGVDSSVTAALLKKQGYFVIGVFMRCFSGQSEKMARLVAKQLGIPFYVLNVEKEFKKKVVDYFLKEYKKGVTPNPCVVCNKEIKFGFLIKKALSLGADFMATGHYARTSLTPLSGVRLFKAVDKNKDQSYFLWQLNQKQLSRVMFPVGSYTKPEVRKIAKKLKLPTAEAPESQEVCFIQNTTNGFLKKYLKTKPGPVIEQAQNGVKKIIGQHQGLWFYTIGQRKGIGLSGGPYFVVAKDFKNNNLIVSKNQKDLLKKELVAKNVNWISGKAPKFPIRVKAKIRYRHDLADAVVYKLQTASCKLKFTKPQRAITPGQSVVFYKGSAVLGGGVIE